MPTGRHTPGATCGASSSPVTCVVMVGSSAADLPCRAVLRLTGETRVVGADRVLDTPVLVGPAEHVDG